MTTEKLGDTGGITTGITPSLDARNALPGQEQRTSLRVKGHFPYSMMTKSAEGKDVKLTGYVEDISTGGTSIVCSTSIPMHAMLAIRIEVVQNGKSEPVIATGKCVNQTFSSQAGGFRYGIQFVKIADDYKKVIERYVKTKTS